MKRLASALLALCMIFALCVFPSTAEKLPTKGETVQAKLDSRFDDYDIDGDRIVTAIITFDGEGVDHDAFFKALSATFGASLECDYTLLLNGIAVKTKYCNLKYIEVMNGVESVYISNTYSLPEVSESNALSGDTYLNNLGYDGDGMLIAVLDTGCTTSHAVFNDYSLVDTKRIDAISNYYFTTSITGLYVNPKIPFTYDYADHDQNVADQSGHGTHVAGIAGGYLAGSFSGAAPASQLLIMKIFGDFSASTSSAIYFQALEDAYRIGVDVINMSIGSASGFVYDNELEDYTYGNIYQKLTNAGITVCIAAGNDGNLGQNNKTELSSNGGTAVRADYTDYGTVGTPSTYSGCISIANATKPSDAGTSFTDADGGSHEYLDGGGAVASFGGTFSGQTVSYVDAGLGRPADLVGLNLAGKIALVSRGETTFQEKLDAVANAGASAMICYNNDAGIISMLIDNYPIPAISIQQTDGLALKSKAVKTITLPPTRNVVGINKSSSVGPTPDLELKPQISGIGTNVISASYLDNAGYSSMTGTSMATPHVAGTLANIIQYLKVTYPGLTKVEYANRAIALAESTAQIISQQDGVYYSPRMQGSGLIDAQAAANAKAYIESPVLSLRDDPLKTGAFTANLTVKNTGGAANSYVIGATALCDNVVTGSDEKLYSDITAKDITSFITVSTGLANNTLTFSAGQTSKTVNVTITLNAAGRQWIDAKFANGSYVEGFIKLDAQTGSDLHATYLAFYGDWDKASAFEVSDFGDYADALYELSRTGNLTADGDEYLDLIDINIDYNKAFQYFSTTDSVGNVLGTTSHGYFPHSDERNAISNILTDGDSYSCDATYSYPMLLRSVRSVQFKVVDSDTNQVYIDTTDNYCRKTMFIENTYEPPLWYSWNAYYPIDEYGTQGLVPSGTHVRLEYYVTLASENAQKRLEWSYPLTVDYTAPQLLYAKYNASTRKLNYIIYDSEFLAHTTAGGNLYTASYGDSVRGLTHYETVDLSGYAGSAITITAEDYATNTKSWTINLATGVDLSTASRSLLTPSGLNITSLPTKTTYNIGEEFSANGLAVKAVYGTIYETQIYNYEISGADTATAGTKTVTVSANGCTTTFTITVNGTGGGSGGETGDIVLGDANGDGNITTADARIILLFSLGTGTPTARELIACDYDQSGTITTTDARNVLVITLS